MIFFKILFLSNCYTHSGVWTHDPKIKSHMLHRLSQPGTLTCVYFKSCFRCYVLCYVLLHTLVKSGFWKEWLSKKHFSHSDSSFATNYPHDAWHCARHLTGKEWSKSFTEGIRWWCSFLARKGATKRGRELHFLPQFFTPEKCALLYRTSSSK